METIDPSLFWRCPDCGAENEDVPELTALPMCSECYATHFWETIVPGLEQERDFIARFRGQSADDFDRAFAEVCGEGCSPADVRKMRVDLTDDDYREDASDRIAAALFYMVREYVKHAEQTIAYERYAKFNFHRKKIGERWVTATEAYGGALFKARRLYRGSM